MRASTFLNLTYFFKNSLLFYQYLLKNGLFQKISTHLLWTILNWVPKNFRISKKGTSILCRIPNPADSKSWEIPEFWKILNGFAGIPIKIHKILGNSWNSSQVHRAFITGFPMSSMLGGGGGGGCIFSKYKEVVQESLACKHPLFWIWPVFSRE